MGQQNLLTSVATKVLFSIVMGSISVAIYACFGLIDWPLGILMALGTLLGGWLGARLSYQIPAHLHRFGIVIVGMTMTAVMFYR